MNIICSNCKTQYDIHNKFSIGQVVRCTKCKQLMQIGVLPVNNFITQDFNKKSDLGAFIDQEEINTSSKISSLPLIDEVADISNFKVINKRSIFDSQNQSVIRSGFLIQKKVNGSESSHLQDQNYINKSIEPDDINSIKKYINEIDLKEANVKVVNNGAIYFLCSSLVFILFGFYCLFMSCHINNSIGETMALITLPVLHQNNDFIIENVSFDEKAKTAKIKIKISNNTPLPIKSLKIIGLSPCCNANFVQQLLMAEHKQLRNMLAIQCWFHKLESYLGPGKTITKDIVVDNISPILEDFCLLSR